MATPRITVVEIQVCHVSLVWVKRLVTLYGYRGELLDRGYHALRFGDNERHIVTKGDNGRCKNQQFGTRLQRVKHSHDGYGNVMAHYFESPVRTGPRLDRCRGESLEAL